MARRWLAARTLGCAVLAVAAVVASSAGPPPAEAAWELVAEHWYTVELAGARAGWMTMSVEADADRYRSVNRMRMSIARGQIPVHIEFTTMALETRDGRPLELRFVSDMAQQSVESQWRFEEDRVVQTTRQGGRETVKEVPPPEAPWLMPTAVQRYWLERREAGAQEITYRMIEPQIGLSPVTVRHVLVGEDEFDVGDRTIPVTTWKTTTSLLPLEAIEQYSTDGHLVLQEVNLPFGAMVTRIATRAEALTDEGERGPELLIKTFVTPSRPLADPHRSTTATLRLRVAQGTMPPLPRAGAQRVEAGEDPAAVTIRIDMGDNQRADPRDTRDPAYLESSAMIGADDPLVRALSAKAVRDAGDDPFDRARAMRAFVHRDVSAKGLDIAFATASETARLKSGDCSEHAVLLCAMLRADGIRARVAIGLIYVDRFLGERGIFGWHMWTQALIDGSWVDFDATLPRRYHAAHVLTTTSSLADGALSAELASTLLLMGNLQIDVVDVGYE